MEDSIYKAPESDLSELPARSLSMAERFAQSRKDMAEASAIQRLNLVWGLRFIVDIVVIGAIIYLFFPLQPNDWTFEFSLIIGITLVLVVLEMVAIAAYFQRRPWCVIPLHIFAAIALLNFPFGTILSIIHFFSMGKVQFNRTFSS